MQQLAPLGTYFPAACTSDSCWLQWELHAGNWVPLYNHGKEKCCHFYL